jgi:hypothetical protein
MTIVRSRTLAVGISLCIGAIAPGTAQSPEGGVTKAAPESEGIRLPKPDGPVVSQSVVDPAAVAAIKRMGAYLRSLKAMEIVSESGLDVVTGEGQRVQLDGITTYKARNPGFVINYVSDLKTRSFIYDGKKFTVYAPLLGIYATVPAPATNQEVLDTVYNRYGIALPLEDLVRWTEPNAIHPVNLKSAYKLGTATLDGVKTDHYVFRGDQLDWEIWIQQGDQPLPRKLVIVDRTNAALPAFTSRLAWKVNPSLTDADFAFNPGKNDVPIELATYEEVVVEKGN